MKDKKDDINKAFLLSQEIPFLDGGKFLANFYNNLGSRDEKIEQYIRTDDLSTKADYLAEIEEHENELDKARAKTLIWYMPGHPDWEEVQKYKRKTPPFQHSDDYRVVYLWREKYEFTAYQAIAIRALYEAYKKGIFQLSSKEINNHYPDKQHFDKLNKVFQKNRAWTDLITYHKEKKGIYSLKNL